MGRYRFDGLTVTLMVVCGLLAGALLGVALRDPTPSATAQSGILAPAGATIALIGTEKNDRIPLFVVDTRSQSIMAYEWGLTNRRLALRFVRTYASDRDLEEYWAQNAIDGPSVKDVRELVKRQTMGR